MQVKKSQAELLQEQAAAQAAEQAQQQAQLQPQAPKRPWQVGVTFGGAVPTPQPGQIDVAANPANVPYPSILNQEQADAQAAQDEAMLKRAKEAAGVKDDTAPDWLEQLEQAKKEHDADSAELRKHSRAQGIVGGIADASSALANLIFAGQTYSPNMYDPKNSMSEKAYERYQKAKAQLDKTHADKLAYLERLQKQRNADRTADIQNRRLDYLIQQEADRARAKEQEYELDNAKFEWKKKMDEGKMTLDQAKYELDKLVRMGKLSLERAGLIKHELEDYVEETKIERDMSGREIGRTKSRVVKHKDGTTSTSTTSTGGNNAPPSRQKNDNSGSSNSNTPPSRR